MNTKKTTNLPSKDLTILPSNWPHVHQQLRFTLFNAGAHVCYIYDSAPMATETGIDCAMFLLPFVHMRGFGGAFCVFSSSTWNFLYISLMEDTRH